MAIIERTAAHQTPRRPIISIASPLDPATGASRAAKSANDVRVSLHKLPHQPGAMVLDHGDDGALVDAEVVVVEPPSVLNGPAAAQPHRGIPQRRVEGIEKTESRVQVVAVPLAHR